MALPGDEIEDPPFSLGPNPAATSKATDELAIVDSKASEGGLGNPALLDMSVDSLEEGLSAHGFEKLMGQNPLCNGKQPIVNVGSCPRMSDQIRTELRRRMEILGKNAKQLSLSAGLGPTAVRDILEERVKNPTAFTLSALAKQLGCTLGDLTGEVKPLRQQPKAVTPDPEIADDLAGVPEIDAVLGAGSAGDGEMEAWSPDGKTSLSADVVREMWGIPDSYLNGELRTTKKRVRIVEVRGDSMEPTLESGDRVMVDLGDRHPSPDGLFALWDGIGVVVKRLEHIPYSNPTAFRIISDNTDRHADYERTGEEINIIGRVIWLARRI